MCNIKKKSLKIIEYSGKQADLDGWLEKFLKRVKCEGYKVLFLGRDKVPTKEQLVLTEASSSNSDKKIPKLADK